MTTTMNRNELNEMELEQVNGGCDIWYLPDDDKIVQCKGCGEYYLTSNYHVCFVGAVLNHDNELQLDLEIGGPAAPQECF